MNELANELEALYGEVVSTFEDLSEEQFNWKHSPDVWSVGQCLDHLVVTNKKELSAFEKAVNGEHTSTFWEKLPWLPGFVGGFLVKAVDPANVKKNKAPAVFAPAESDVSKTVLEDYAGVSQEIIKQMRLADDMETGKMIITSPVASVATYSLADAFKIVVLHDRRHFEQAKRLMDMAMFPR